MTLKLNVSLLGVLGLMGGVVATAQEQKLEPGHQVNWGRNLILNSSFENEFHPWSLTLGARQDGARVQSTLTIDPEIAHDGHSSLRLSGDAETTVWLSAKSAPVAVREDQHYVLAVWIRPDRVERALSQYDNCNAYVQFLDSDGKIVHVGRSPVRATAKVMGTKNWTRVSVVVKAPPRAVAAEVGVALTCSGTAWFDEVSLFEATQVNWTQKETDRFIYFYEVGNEPPKQILAGNDRFLKSVEAVLGIKLSDKMRYFKYYSGERMTVLTGDTYESHYRRSEVHALKWDDRIVLIGAVLSEVGESTPFLANGIAAYTLLSIRGQNIHAPAAKKAAQGSLQSSAKLQDPQAFAMFPGVTVQVMSSSFVGYLIEVYGIDKFKRFYAFDSPEEAAKGVRDRAEAVYDRTLEQLDSDWHAFLKSR